MRQLQAERVAFFDGLLDAFLQAEEQLGSCRWQGRVAGRTLRLRGAGPQPLQAIVPALRHWVAADSEQPDFTIHLWDGAGGQRPLPLLVHSFLQAVANSKYQSLDVRYELKGFNDDRIRTVYRLGPCNILSVFDKARAMALYWVDDASRLPYWELGSPLQTLLNWWAEGLGMQYLHAAAVGSSEGAVLLTGEGGSGKSSTALACLQAGMGYLADDYCLAQEGRVWSLYGTAKLIGQADLGRFPELTNWVRNPVRERSDKILVDVFGCHPRRMVLEAPLKAVIIPQVPVTPTARSSLSRVRGSTALLALAPTTLFQLAGTDQGSLARMTSILRQVPAYRLDLGKDVEDLPALLGDLL